MEEASIQATASWYMRTISKDKTVSEATPTPPVLIFRATLRNGEMFALDPRNAMYNSTTTAEHEHGTFQWDSYMDRLLVTDRAALDVQPLRRLPPYPEPHGNLADGQANIFVWTDIRATAEMKVLCMFTTLDDGLRGHPQSFLPLTDYQTTFAKLLSRSSSDDDHASQVFAFNKQLQEGIRLTRSMGIKEMLLGRLQLEEVN
jgi:hypothetical protein